MDSWDSDELERTACCPACGAASKGYRHRLLRDFLENVPGEWDLQECAECGSLFLDPRPATHAIGKAYVSYYTHRDSAKVYASDNGHSLLWRLANGYVNACYGAQRSPALGAGRWVLPLIPPLRQQLDFFYRDLPRKSGSLLDVGCGNGVFLLRAHEAGWDVAGIEPDPNAVAAARVSGLDVWNGTLDDHPQGSAYDVVTASHVLEHVHDPRLFLRQVSARLRTGGTIWLATPNVRSLGHRWYGRSWRGLEPPRHLTIFSARALRSLLEGTGFSTIRFHRRGRGSHYILDSSLELARRGGVDAYRLAPWLVDMAASVVATAAEELVVSAKKLERP